MSGLRVLLVASISEDEPYIRQQIVCTDVVPCTAQPALILVHE